ncbi:MAG: hypothetical protein A3G87_04915 [Omnitrophica bacterium RIFCSPLOWO2_12_FULL_50_11]|nr:MAG: hypothetical protein A3G87_04915 [Omnitrophica bacterium RIFCSPLOWO2_12_FULL_50_11]
MSGRGIANLFFFGVALLFTAVGSSWADEVGDLTKVNQELSEKVDALEKKIDQLESRLSKTEADVSRPAAPVAAAVPVEGVYEVEGANIHVGGFIDTSVNWNFQSPATGVNGNSTLRAFDRNANTFDLNNAQFELSRPAPADGGVGFKTEFMYGTDAQVADSSGFTTTDEFSIQEAYIETKIPIGTGLTVWAGKFATLHGAEVIENYKNWNSSRSFLFTLAIPFTHVGARAMYGFLDGKVTTALGLVNGWDNAIDTNDVKDIEATVGWNPSENFSTSATLMHGSQQAGDRDNPRGILDFVATWKPLPEDLPGLSLKANLDYGWEEDVNVAREDQYEDWIGYALYAQYELNDRLTLAARWEQFWDDQGSRIGSGGSRLWEQTYTADMKVYENLLARLEYRHDGSVDKNFDSSTSDDQDTVGLSLIYLLG